MMEKETKRIYDIVTAHSQSPVASHFFNRLKEGQLTRDENTNTHFCVYFAAYDAESKQVFIGHHKKSGLWLFNGGHIEKGETPEETLKREIGEEWGLEVALQSIGEPKLLTITHIENPTIECKEHYDIWYFVRVSKQNFNPKKENLDSEFYTTDWKDIEQARNIVSDPSTLKALLEFEKLYY